MNLNDYKYWRVAEMSENKKGYGIYDLTEDIMKRMYKLESIDRNDATFHAEEKKVERLVKRMNIIKNSPQEKFFIPADQYDDFLENFYILYENDDFYKIYQDMTKKNPKLNENKCQIMDKLVNTLLDIRCNQLQGKAKEAYEQFKKDLHSYTYHEEKVALYSRIKQTIKEDLILVDDLLSEEAKLEFLQIYEEEILTLRGNMIEICKLKIKQEKYLKEDREAFWLGNNVEELNKIFNGFQNQEDIEKC